MKKCLVLLCSVFVFSVNGQIYLTEKFEDFFPTEWTKISDASDVGWSTLAANFQTSDDFIVPDNNSQKIIGTNDDRCDCDKSNERLISPSLDFTTAEMPYLFFDFYFLKREYQGREETVTIRYSIDDGNTWIDLVELSGEFKWRTQAIDLTQLAGNADVKIEWHYNDDGGWLYGYMMDNVVIKEIDQNDVRLQSTAVRTRALEGQTIDIKGVIANWGSEELNSLVITWDAGNGEQMEILDGLNVPFLGETDFTHSVPFQVVEGNSPIEISISIPNGNVDADLSNNNQNIEVEGFVAQFGKKAVCELYTSTAEGWSPSGEVWLNKLIEYYPDHVIPIAVHKGDPMETSQYDNGFNSQYFPRLHVDRSFLLFHNSGFDGLESSLLSRLQSPSPGILGSSVNATGGIDEYIFRAQFDANMDLSGDYRLAIVVVEDEVTGTDSSYDQANFYSGGAYGPFGDYADLPNPVPAEEMVYNYVGRDILDGYFGDENSLPPSISNGESYTWEFEPITLPSEIDLAQVEVVVLLINPIGEIVNAETQSFEDALNNTIVNTNNLLLQEFVKVYSNSTSNIILVNLDLATQEDVEITLFNSLGQKLTSQKYEQLNDPMTISFDASDLTSNIYYVNVQLDSQSITKKVLIFK